MRFFFVLPKIRRDKQGRLYIFSEGYERAKLRERQTQGELGGISEQLKMVSVKVDQLGEKVSALEVARCGDRLRQEIFICPEKVSIIEGLADRYFGDYHGNGYLVDIYRVWKRQYADKIVAERVG